MKEWESTLKEAAQAFNDKIFSAAIFLNKQALDLAIVSFNKYVKDDAEKSVAAVMVSYFSLAKSYIAISDFKQAYNMFQLSFNFLQIINRDPYKDMAISIAASHGISHLKNEWSLFVQQYEEQIKQLSPSLTKDFQINLYRLTSPSSIVH